ncbi:MAG: EamA family transporter [Pseudomonadota bacterium]
MTHGLGTLDGMIEPDGRTRLFWVRVYGLALTTLTIWGVGVIINKAAVDVTDPLLLAVLRAAASSLSSIVAVVTLRIAFPRGAGVLPWLIACSACAYVGFPLLFTFGLELTAASRAAAVFASISIFTGMWSFLIERRRPTIRWIVGAAIALVGEAVLLGSGALGADLSGGSLAGDLLIVAAVATAAFGYASGGRLSRSVPATAVTFWSGTLGGVFALPALLWLIPSTDWAHVPALGWIGALYLGTIASTLAYVFWYRALADGGTSRIGMLQFLQPILIVVLGVVLLGEEPTLALGVSLALVLIGVVITQKD